MCYFLSCLGPRKRGCAPCSESLQVHQPWRCCRQRGQAVPQASAIFIEGSHDSRTVEILRIARCSAVAHRASTLGNSCSPGISNLGSEGPRAQSSRRKALCFPSRVILVITIMITSDCRLGPWFPSVLKRQYSGANCLAPCVLPLPLASFVTWASYSPVLQLPRQ